jgi:hypothetical protein
VAYLTNFTHHLEIDNVPLSTPAWEHLDIQALYSGAATRGENRVMPGAAGRRALPKRADETTRTLTLAVFGFQRWDGTVNSDPVAGLWENIGHLHEFIIDTPATPDSTRLAKIVRIGQPDLFARIQVLGFEVDETYSPAAVSASMDIAVIPGGFS